MVGVGGVGKTRLALQAAADSAEDFEDGVWFCDLAPVTDPGAVPFAVAAALGLPERSAAAMVDTITQSLAQRRALVVVDNCEHVIEQAADVVDAIVQRCSSVTILATSREALALDGEVVVPGPKPWTTRS
jgi:predicted ATPase